MDASASSRSQPLCSTRAAAAPKPPLPSSNRLPAAPAPAAAAGEEEEGTAVQQLVLNLFDPALREDALALLSKKRVRFQELAPLLWNSFGVTTVLLKEIIAVYQYISPPTLSHAQSNRLCNVLALLQCVASHPDTKNHLIDANIPIYLYPILNTTCKDRPFEYARLTSLGVIGALVKFDNTDIITYLINSEVVPLCLSSMEVGSELSKTVATFIVQKIITDIIGLNYMCDNADRFFSLAVVLGSMLMHLAQQPSQSPRLLKHIMRCFLRLSEHPRGAIRLKSCFPAVLQDGRLLQHLNNDPMTQGWFGRLLQNVNMATHHAISRTGFHPMTGR